MIYRIVQEQINNTIKYAAATHISIVIRLLSSTAEIMISDNGKGFDTTKVRSGIGLKNIQNRLEVFQGNLEINSSPGRGCELRATFNTHAN